jgi:micrococcal nuclease
MKRASLLCILVTAILPILVAAQERTMEPYEAGRHVGERVTVCGKVVSTHWAYQTRGQPTFINLDKPHPSEIFTIVIWGSDRAKFGKPERDYRDKDLCVTGVVRVYRRVPEIIARDPSQITVR